MSPTAAAEDSETCCPAEAAELLDVHVKTVRRWLAAGTFPAPAIKVGGVWRINATALKRSLGLSA